MSARASRPATQDEIDLLGRLRTALSPEGGFQVVDDYGKWLFGSGAVLGSVATGFGVSGFGALHGAGRDLFLGAIAAVAASFALVVVSLKPERLGYNPNSLDSMQQAIQLIIPLRSLSITMRSSVMSSAMGQLTPTRKFRSRPAPCLTPGLGITWL